MKSIPIPIMLLDRGDGSRSRIQKFGRPSRHSRRAMDPRCEFRYQVTHVSCLITFLQAKTIDATALLMANFLRCFLGFCQVEDQKSKLIKTKHYPESIRLTWVPLKTNELQIIP